MVRINVELKHIVAFFSGIIALAVITFLALFVVSGLNLARISSAASANAGATSFLAPLAVFIFFIYLNKERKLEDGFGLSLVHLGFSFVMFLVTAYFAASGGFGDIGFGEYAYDHLFNVGVMFFNNTVIYCGLFSALDKKNRSYGKIGLFAMPVAWLAMFLFASGTTWSELNVAFWSANIFLFGNLALEGFAFGSLMPELKRMTKLSESSALIGFPLLLAAIYYVVNIAAGSTEYVRLLNVFVQYLIFGLILYASKEVKLS